MLSFFTSSSPLFLPHLTQNHIHKLQMDQKMPFSTPKSTPNTPPLHNHLLFTNPFTSQSASQHQSSSYDLLGGSEANSDSIIRQDESVDLRSDPPMESDWDESAPPVTQFVSPKSVECRSLGLTAPAPLEGNALISAAMASSASASAFNYYSDSISAVSSPEPHSPTWTSNACTFIKMIPKTSGSSSISSGYHSLFGKSHGAGHETTGSKSSNALGIDIGNNIRLRDNLLNRQRGDSWSVNSVKSPEFPGEFPLRLGRSLPNELDVFHQRKPRDKTSFLDTFHGYESISQSNQPELQPSVSGRDPRSPRSAGSGSGIKSTHAPEPQQKTSKSHNYDDNQDQIIVPSQPEAFYPADFSSFNSSKHVEAKKLSSAWALAQDKQMVRTPVEAEMSSKSKRDKDFKKIFTSFGYENEVPLICSPPPASTQVPQIQDPTKIRSSNDLYTPRWVRCEGRNKEGYCPLCPEGGWYNMKISSYNYHLAYAHGISASSGKRFDSPTEIRIGIGNKERKEVRCPNCKEWIRLSGRGSVVFRAYYRHARSCHTKTL